MKIRKLNGTTLEGGGQLVRLSVCLSALTGKPIQIHNIRGKRDGGGGLKEQHLSCVKWLAAACDAEVEGMWPKSQTLTFEPGKRRDGWWEPATIEIGGKMRQVRATNISLATSGAVTLVLQAILPFLLLAGSEKYADSSSKTPKLANQLQNMTIDEPKSVLLTISGGTNVSNSPSIDYVTQVLLPNYHLLGLPLVELLNDRKDVRRRFTRGWATGHVSKGTVSLLIRPTAPCESLPAMACPQRGRITKFTITILAPQDLRDRLKGQVTQELCLRFCSPHSDLPIENIVNEDSGHPKRLHLLIVAHTASGFRLGSDCLYWGRIEKGGKAREEAANRLVEQAVAGIETEIRSGRCIDEWMEDQLVVFQALAKGRSKVNSSDLSQAKSNAQSSEEADRGESKEQREGTRHEASLHTRTVRWVANEILGVEFDDDGDCEGVGYVAGSGIT